MVGAFTVSTESVVALQNVSYIVVAFPTGNISQPDWGRKGNVVVSICTSHKLHISQLIADNLLFVITYAKT